MNAVVYRCVCSLTSTCKLVIGVTDEGFTQPCIYQVTLLGFLAAGSWMYISQVHAHTLSHPYFLHNS